MQTTRFEQYARIAGVTVLVLGCLLVLKPFMGAILFAGVLCFSTWPAYAWLRDRWGGRSALTASVFVILIIVTLALPIGLAAQSLAVHSAKAVDYVRQSLEAPGSMELPTFIGSIPIVGSWIQDYSRVILESREELVALGKQLADPARKLALAAGGIVGEGLIQILIATFVAFFFYRDGERIRHLLSTSVTRLAGEERGPELVATARNAVRGVVYGLLGTAFAQAAVALVGFLIAGVPAAFILAALTFILSLVPMGPVFVWGGAALWLYSEGQTGWAIFMVIYGTAVISSVDNFLKPILMSRAGGISLLLVVLGVFGGALAFGFIGLFIGPALLAVAWNLTKAWLETSPTLPPVHESRTDAR